MGKKKLLAALFSGVLLISVAMTGCSSTKESASKNSSGEKTTLNVFQYKVEFKDQFETLAEQYMEENPNVKVNVQTVGGGTGYDPALKAKFASGEEPGLFNIRGPEQLNEYKDRLANLKDTKAASEALPGTLETVSENEDIYGLPFNQEGYGYIYNKDIVKKAGVDLTTVTNFEELKKAVEVIDSKKKELKIDAVFALPAKEKWVMGKHLVNAFLAPEFNNSVLETFNAKEVKFTHGDQLKQALDLQNNFSVQPNANVDYAQQVEELFSTGRVAMIQQGNWIYPTVEQMDEDLAKNKIGIIPIPVNGEMKMPIGVPAYWAVNKKASEAEQKVAKDFLDWMYTSDKGKEIVLTEFKFIPAYKGYEASKIADPLSREIYKYVNKENTSGWVFNGYPSGWSDVVGAELQKYLAKQSTWEEALKSASEQWSQTRK